jgi:G3E family GTPase
VIIETTGVANPGPVAQTFFMDEEVATHYLLDAVVTVVDAQHAMRQLDDNEEAQRQVGFADRLLLSKTELVDEDTVARLSRRLTRLNPRAPIVRLDPRTSPLADVLDLRGFNLNEKLELDPGFLAEVEAARAGDHVHGDDCAPGCGHGHHHHAEGEDGHGHHHPGHGHGGHTDEIAAFVFRSERPFDSLLLDQFLGSMVQVYGPRMLRYKGVLLMKDADRKVIFQGVHQMMGSDIGAKWADDEIRGSKMVFIGKNLPENIFILGLEQCLV